MSQRKSFTSLRNPSSERGIKVDDVPNMGIHDSINEDIEISSTTLRTLEVMKICRKRIIYPFNIMLMMVGWRPVGSQMYHYDNNQSLLCLFNNILLGILIALMVFSYTYQVLTCRFVMSPEDKITTSSPVPANNTSSMVLLTNSTCKEPKIIECRHTVTTYVIPNLIQFMAYMLGILHYRFRKNEDIYGLMEKALQYYTSMEQNKKSQYRVTSTLTIWMVAACLWVCLSLTNHIMYDVAFDTFSNPFYSNQIYTEPKIISGLGNFLFILDIFGFLLSSIVTTLVVLNYVLYCELVKFYVCAISKKIEMRNIKLNVVKNDIQIIGIAIDLINATTGTMTSLIYVYTMSLFVGGMNMLLNSEMYNINQNMMLAFRIYFVIHLIPLLIIPLVQCARVNKATDCFKEWALHMSVFGYRKEKRKELDSFLLYTIGYSSKAKLLSVPLQWPHLFILCSFGGLIFLSIIQAGVLSNLRFIGNL